MTIQVLKINQGTKFEIWLFFHCLKLLFNVLLVQLRKYGHAGKQVSRTVLWVLWHTGAITHDFLGAQSKIQSHMRPVSC